MNQTLYKNTPLYQSHYLKAAYNRNVFYKMDCYQPSGSFKIRGMEVICRDYIAKGKTEFVASSGGNAGYSLAYVGMKLKVKVKVIVPETTASRMVTKIKELGADVEVIGKDWNEAHQHATALSKERDLPYISPFDHPLLWQGHSSVIDECAAEIAEPDKIIVAVGGGGLINGVFEGMKRNGWNSLVIAAETTGAASFAASYRSGKLVALDKIDTIATSLGAKQIASQTLELAKNQHVSPYVISDQKALLAVDRFLDEYNVLVEPACGAAISYVYDNEVKIQPEEKVLVIVCGGVGADQEQLRAYQSKLY
ncbi:MAG: pyridoxal-phosphate dependent enzyme [Bacteroidota bacterium]